MIADQMVSFTYTLIGDRRFQYSDLLYGHFTLMVELRL